VRTPGGQPTVSKTFTPEDPRQAVNLCNIHMPGPAPQPDRTASPLIAHPRSNPTALWAPPGFGRPWQDRTLGEPPKYWTDVYDGGRLKEKEMAAQAKAAVSVKPFVSAGSPRRVFTPNLFLSQQSAAAAADKGGTATASGRGGSAGAGHKPWRSGGPPKKVGGALLLPGVIRWQAKGKPPLNQSTTTDPRQSTNTAITSKPSCRVPRTLYSAPVAGTLCQTLL